jgi:hypothetical protein
LPNLRLKFPKFCGRTVRYWFLAPHRNYKSAARYLGLIPARVVPIKNSRHRLPKSVLAPPVHFLKLFIRFNISRLMSTLRW